MPEVNIHAHGETEEDLTRAMNEAVKQCDIGWNRSEGTCKDGKSGYFYAVVGYEDSPIAKITF